MNPIKYKIQAIENVLDQDLSKALTLIDQFLIDYPRNPNGYLLKVNTLPPVVWSR